MPEKRFVYKRQRHQTAHRRTAQRQLQTVEGAVKVMTWLGAKGPSERAQIEVHLFREGMKKPLAELQQGGYALWANLNRKSAAEPLHLAITEIEEKALMTDFRLLVKLFPKIAKAK
ncbi:MAG: hypothetical protein JW744_01430 [Candidatus Diapherotrites archaeon]|uniref:Uncharacterized protein n=1 Tax=Candidatus Iainarchaeum sp. TaxID=3101447 RepID=A0A938YXF5_9ARCH|nr:hypothetical protein [Candidatus Diapherotrites archaeon]